MNTEDSATQTAPLWFRRRMIVLTLLILVIAGLSYAAIKFWGKSHLQLPANAPVGGKSVVISVEGMSCSVCVASVKKTLKETIGVGEAQVNLEKGEAELRYDAARTSPEKLARVIEEMGYKAHLPGAKEKAQ